MKGSNSNRERGAGFCVEEEDASSTAHDKGCKAHASLKQTSRAVRSRR